MSDENVVQVPPDDEPPAELAVPAMHVKLDKPVDINWAAVWRELPRRDRRKVAKRLMTATPDARRAARDRTRRILAVSFVVTVVLDGAAALVLKATHAISLEGMKEWLILALVPLTPGLTAAIAFWFPTKEVD